MNYFFQHKDGLILTLIFHLTLVLILFKVGLFAPLPPPEEKGILLDFGVSPDQGMGLTEPAPAMSQENDAIPLATALKKRASTKKVTSSEEKILTQDFEKTAAIKAQQKQDQIIKQKQLAEDKRLKDSIQKINDERIAELNRLDQIHKQDSIRKAKEQSQIAQINSRVKNAFGVTGMGTDPNSSGQGNSNKPGNQGSPDGVAGGAQNGTGSGIGNGAGNGRGTAITYSISGRKVKTLIKPTYPGNEEGIVVVEVTVDKTGKVNKATPGVTGSSSMNAGLWEAARKAALSTKFNENVDAPVFQTGTITYHFVLN